MMNIKHDLLLLKIRAIKMKEKKKKGGQKTPNHTNQKHKRMLLFYNRYAKMLSIG